MPGSSRGPGRSIRALGGAVVAATLLSGCAGAPAVTIYSTLSPAGVSTTRPVPDVAGLEAPPIATSTGPTATRTGPSGLAIGSPGWPMPLLGTCHALTRPGGLLPDRHCTPGAVDAAVTDRNVGSTICRSGWTATIAAPPSRMRRASALSYGLPRTVVGEYDALVPLLLGGAPDDPRNLWFEPGATPNRKDGVEHTLHSAVCKGLVPLTTAQRAIAADWTTALAVAGLQLADGKACLRTDRSRCVTADQALG
jgi:hypothetical protein